MWHFHNAVTLESKGFDVHPHSVSHLLSEFIKDPEHEENYSLDPQAENNDQGCQSAKENQLWLSVSVTYSPRCLFPFNIAKKNVWHVTRMSVWEDVCFCQDVPHENKGLCVWQRGLWRDTHLEYTEAWHYYLTELKLCYQIRHTCQFPLGVFPRDPCNLCTEQCTTRKTKG